MPFAAGSQRPYLTLIPDDRITLTDTFCKVIVLWVQRSEGFRRLHRLEAIGDYQFLSHGQLRMWGLTVTVIYFPARRTPTVCTWFKLHPGGSELCSLTYSLTAVLLARLSNKSNNLLLITNFIKASGSANEAVYLVEV